MTNHRWTALDQIRTLAAFMVFCWHFTHGATGDPSPFEGAPAFPFAALFDEGHVGVALFMCLSGYLFARLLDGKSIKYGAFFLARAIRLFPLLAFVFAVEIAFSIARGEPITPWALNAARGFVFPEWPNGGWSLGVELHFYLILPFLLFIQGRHPAWPLCVLAAAIILRALIFADQGNVQDAAYWTIFGRIDQFILGIYAFRFRTYLANNTAVAIGSALAIGTFYYLFDDAGGFYKLDPSARAIWVLLPTLEGLTFSALVGWYDNTFDPRGRVAELIANVGFYSYGIYLLHFFFVFRLAHGIDKHILDLDNFYVAWAVALPCFCAMLVPAWLAYHLIEKPFQRFKPRYYRAPRADVGATAAVGVPAA